MVRDLLKRFDKLSSCNVLLFGDFLLDAYTIGRVKRISPEAPVPILEVVREESRPGGAGNVAINLAALGAKVFAVGRVGSDASGEILLSSLQKKGIDTSFFIEERGYLTPVKKRMMAEHQQLLRVDHEKIVPLDSSLEKEWICRMEALDQPIDVIAISDYAKGFLTPSFLRFIIDFGKKRKIPVVVDPKGIDFTKYEGATLIKPNRQEAYGAAKLSFDTSLQEVAKKLLKEVKMQWLLVTRSEEGMSLFNAKGVELHFPVRSKEVLDVTGAGDTALAMVCVGLGSKLDLADTVQLANIASGIAVERLGCAEVFFSEVQERLCHFNTASF